MGLNEKELKELKEAKRLLENPGLAVKLTNALGAPIEQGFNMLPKKMGGAVKIATKTALEKAVGAAVMTMNQDSQPKASNFFHKAAAAASGAAGGAFGLAALSIELPISTVIMFRSIMDIARENGENIRSPSTLAAGLEVFALGGPNKDDDAGETGYYAVRTALSRTVGEAVEYLARKGAVDGTAPALVRLISTIASRFGIVVSEKAAASAIPIIGAAGGSLVNTLFMDHFQCMAKGHFTVRRLERTHGKEEIKRLYDQL
ncbi:EcsC family protein [Desulfatibacillum aliphaticivorans]|uniref:EcsC family protein n=1 Tax=Desulfatibacillum aliphaticivorans TaxID=218208 RepID=UPI0004109AF3|nr:EcsC family protein [Desulfatibacillum aliphaticivorans]